MSRGAQDACEILLITFIIHTMHLILDSSFPEYKCYEQVYLSKQQKFNTVDKLLPKNRTYIAVFTGFTDSDYFSSNARRPTVPMKNIEES